MIGIGFLRIFHLSLQLDSICCLWLWPPSLHTATSGRSGRLPDSPPLARSLSRRSAPATDRQSWARRQPVVPEAEKATWTAERDVGEKGPAADSPRGCRGGRRAGGWLGALARRSISPQPPAVCPSSVCCTDAELHDDAAGGLAADSDVEENFGLGHFIRGKLSGSSSTEPEESPSTEVGHDTTDSALKLRRPCYLRPGATRPDACV